MSKQSMSNIWLQSDPESQQRLQQELQQTGMAAATGRGQQVASDQGLSIPGDMSIADLVGCVARAHINQGKLQTTAGTFVYQGSTQGSSYTSRQSGQHSGSQDFPESSYGTSTTGASRQQSGQQYDDTSSKMHGSKKTTSDS